MTPPDPDKVPPLPTAIRMARLLRHEVGDLLQSVYSTTAVLMDRLPADLGMERRLLGDLKQRAEVCRYELDAALELVSQPPLTECELDLTVTVASVVSGLRQRYPALQLRADSGRSAMVKADPRALNAALSMLLLGLGQNARKEVHLEVRSDERQVELRLQHAGYAATPAQLAWLHEPFATTQQALFGLALGVTARVVRAGGGEVNVESPAEGGVCVRILFPVHADR